MNMQRSVKHVVGFTLIELMIVIAIIGILAAVAIPQYQRYAVRSEATQAVNAIRPFQLALGEFVLLNGNIPANATDLPGIAGTDEASTCNGIVETVEYARNEAGDGVTLTATFYGEPADGEDAAVTTATRTNCGGNTVTLPAQLAGATIEFTGTLEGNEVVWVVAETGSVDVEFLPPL